MKLDSNEYKTWALDYLSMYGSIYSQLFYILFQDGRSPRLCINNCLAFRVSSKGSTMPIRGITAKDHADYNQHTVFVEAEKILPETRAYSHLSRCTRSFILCWVASLRLYRMIFCRSRERPHFSTSWVPNPLHLGLR